MEEDDPASYGRDPAGQEQPHGTAQPDHAGHHHDPGDKKYQTYERAYWAITGAASVLATIAAGIAAWYAVGAYEASLESVAEARKQVIAAREANELSRRTLAAAIGASVHVGPAEFRELTHADGQTRINIIIPIGNDGGTTTRGLTFSTACNVTVTPAINPFNYNALNNRPTYNLTLPPKEKVRPMVCSYTTGEWMRITANKGSIYVYGRASYRDTIQPAERHNLEFCTRLDEVTYTVGTLNPGPFATGYECSQHNCIDDECEAQR